MHWDTVIWGFSLTIPHKFLAFSLFHSTLCAVCSFACILMLQHLAYASPCTDIGLQHLNVLMIYMPLHVLTLACTVLHSAQPAPVHADTEECTDDIHASPCTDIGLQHSNVLMIYNASPCTDIGLQHSNVLMIFSSPCTLWQCVLLHAFWCFNMMHMPLHVLTLACSTQMYWWYTCLSMYWHWLAALKCTDDIHASPCTDIGLQHSNVLMIYNPLHVLTLACSTQMYWWYTSSLCTDIGLQHSNVLMIYNPLHVLTLACSTQMYWWYTMPLHVLTLACSTQMYWWYTILSMYWHWLAALKCTDDIHASPCTDIGLQHSNVLMIYMPLHVLTLACSTQMYWWYTCLSMYWHWLAALKCTDDIHASPCTVIGLQHSNVLMIYMPLHVLTLACSTQMYWWYTCLSMYCHWLAALKCTDDIYASPCTDIGLQHSNVLMIYMPLHVLTLACSTQMYSWSPRPATHTAFVSICRIFML